MRLTPLLSNAGSPPTAPAPVPAAAKAGRRLPFSFDKNEVLTFAPRLRPPRCVLFGRHGVFAAAVAAVVAAAAAADDDGGGWQLPPLNLPPPPFPPLREACSFLP